MSNILTGFNMQGNDPIDDRIVSKSNLETLEQYLNRVPVQKRYYGLTFFALDKNNELRKYTFQTSLIEPTIDDNEEEIERIDKELQEHVSNKAIHKTSEEIRSEIVDADIPDTIARVQWTLDQINTAVINLIGGASDEYNTLKRIQTKIEELRAEMESQLYGDDGGTVLKTLEQALKFLNQYKDFIVDIPDNFVNKQDIVDNLTTDDPTKVLSAKQGKILSDTLTNYFESAMQSIRTETDRAINAENRIEAKLDQEIDRSIKEDQRIDSKLDAEIERSTTEDNRLDKKIDAETTRATEAESNLNTKIETETDRAEGEESRIEAKLDNEITRSTNKDTEHDNRLQALEGQTHEQNTDLGTTNSTFQLKYNTGNKIKHESDAISVRNAADTDYVNFIAKNATFKGDLLVEGQSFVTEAETVEIKDNLLLLNKGEVGAGVTKGIAGLEIDRGTEPNYQIIFDESDNRFKAGEIGDIQCLALRDGDNSMVNGMFTSWDSSTKRLKTTNIVPSSSLLYFGDNKKIALSYNNSEGLSIYNGNNALAIFPTANNTTFRCTGNNFQLVGKLITLNETISSTFRRTSDNSEVLYHADIVNNLTSGGTNKVLSAEQGKLLQNSITNIQGSYLPLSGGTMTGSIIMSNNITIQSKDSSGNSKRLIGKGSDNVTYIGDSDGHTFLYSDAADIIHVRNETSYRIWDAYNLSNPVRYTLDSSGYPYFKDVNGTNFSYIKAGSSGIIPNYGASLSSEGSGTCGTSGWSFQYGYFANVYTNRIMFSNNTWTNDLAANRNSNGYLQVLDAYNASSAGGPTNYGTVLQINSRIDHWANQLWFPGGADASKNLYYRHMAYDETTYGEWIKLATTSDLGNYLPLSGGTISSSKPNPLTINSTHASQSSIYFSRGGVNKGTVGFYENLGSFLQNITGEILAVKSDGAYYGVNNNSLRKLATVTDLNNYLPLTGGTLNTANSVVLSLNSAAKFETCMRVLRNGTPSAALGFRDGLGAYIYNYNSSKYLFIDNNGDARVGTTNGSTRLALITDIPTVSGYLPLSGGTMTGILTMESGKLATIDNIYGGGTNWGNGPGAYNIQVSNDGGQTPLLLARRSGAAIDTTVAAERLLSMELLDKGTFFKVNMSGVEALQLEVTSFTNKVGIGRLFGKTIATTDQIPSIPSISISNSGSGNAVTAISASGHTLTVTKGATYLTSSSLDGYATQSWANGQFASLALYNTTRSYATIRTVGNEICIGNTAATFAINQILVNYRVPSGCTYAPASWVWRAGSSTSYAVGYWGNLYMNDALVATQTWSTGQFPTKSGTGASGTWGISISGNAATATNATQLGGTAASSYVKANDNISRLTNDRNYVRSTSTLKVADIQVLDGGTPGSEAGILYIVLE